MLGFSLSPPPPPHGVKARLQIGGVKPQGPCASCDCSLAPPPSASQPEFPPPLPPVGFIPEGMQPVPMLWIYGQTCCCQNSI